MNRIRRNWTIAFASVVMALLLAAPQRMSAWQMGGSDHDAGEEEMLTGETNLSRNPQGAKPKGAVPTAPPKDIVLTTRLDRLLPTIRSRCQQVAFGPLDGGSMQAWLDAGGLSATGAEREWLLRFAEGSPGAAVAGERRGLHAWWSEFQKGFTDMDRGRLPGDLAERMHERAAELAEAVVREMPGWQVVTPAQMGIVTFRYAPEGVTGERLNDLNQALVANPEFNRWICGRTPAGRWGQPQELSGAVVFLASAASDFVNGQVLYVDGGLMAAL